MKLVFLIMPLLLILLFGCGQKGNGNPHDESDSNDIPNILDKAEKGDAKAQAMLGMAYAVGDGVRQDYEEAIKWFRLAAEQGNVAAQTSLGIAYWNGEGVPQDYKESVMWFRLAAERGGAYAQTMLSRAYISGKGITKDYVQAYAWANVAAAQEIEQAKHILDELANMGMTSEQLEEAKLLSRKYEQHADSLQKSKK